MSTRKTLRKVQGVREDFHAAVKYLAEKYTYSELGNGVGVHPSTVWHWVKDGRLPPPDLIVKVIEWAIGEVLFRLLLKSAGDKLEEHTPSLQAALDHIKTREHTYDGIANSLKDTLADSVEARTINRWHKGTQPRQKGKMPNKIECKIISRVARETGKANKAFWSAYPYFTPLVALLGTDGEKTKWVELRKEYEAQEARGGVD